MFPFIEIVPVPATWRPCKKSRGVKSSIKPMAKIIPPLGPPVRSTSKEIFLAMSSFCLTPKTGLAFRKFKAAPIALFCEFTISAAALFFSDSFVVPGG